MKGRSRRHRSARERDGREEPAACRLRCASDLVHARPDADRIVSPTAAAGARIVPVSKQRYTLGTCRGDATRAAKRENVGERRSPLGRLRDLPAGAVAPWAGALSVRGERRADGGVGERPQCGGAVPVARCVSGGYGYLLGSYRIATAPEPNSSRLTSVKSTCFDSPANNVGPWPASLGCTTNSYSSINPSSANASGSFTPPINSPLPDSRLSC